jgi:radical SAM superfamily enzyme YgiQ (UPF0313 family)
MTVCLVRCPSPFLVDERAFPPLGLMAVGAGLKQKGMDVVVYDGNIEQLPLDYPAYGFGPTSPEYPSALDCLHRIKDANPSARVIVGGTHVTLLYGQCLEDGWDGIVVGDGEEAAWDAFYQHNDIGIIYRAEDRPLDQYPIPDRTLVNIKDYNFRLYGRPATTVMGSRGCPFKCAFCCKNNNRVRLASAERMIEEIGIIHDQFGYDALAFPEDIFTLNKARTTKVCKYLKEKGIIWRCLVRADLTVRYGMDFLDMMVDSGCVGIGIGVESGSNTVLRNINKQETVEQMKQAVAMFQSRNVFIKGFFIVGLPGENEETLQETEDFLQEAQFDDIDCKIYQPYPCSPIVDNPEKYDVHWDAIPLSTRECRANTTATSLRRHLATSGSWKRGHISRRHTKIGRLQ